MNLNLFSVLSSLKHAIHILLIIEDPTFWQPQQICETGMNLEDFQNIVHNFKADLRPAAFVGGNTLQSQCHVFILSVVSC